MTRLAFGLAALLALSACGAAEPKWAPDEAVQAARYVYDGPPSVTLYTVVGSKTGAGAHSGLLVNASERVMFDPAGTWYHPYLPERNDVHFGITPKIVNFYIDYHARETFNVIEETVPVSPQVAETVMRRVKAYGAVPKAQCAASISEILQGLPGFEAVRPTWYPNQLAAAFQKAPGSTRRVITDDDADNNHGVLLVQATEGTR